jgi:hypothetical protein
MSARAKINSAQAERASARLPDAPKNPCSTMPRRIQSLTDIKFLSPLVGFRTRDGVRENRQFIDIQFAVMILIRKRELHFEKSKYLSL